MGQREWKGEEGREEACVMAFLGDGRPCPSLRRQYLEQSPCPLDTSLQHRRSRFSGCDLRLSFSGVPALTLTLRARILLWSGPSSNCLSFFGHLNHYYPRIISSSSSSSSSSDDDNSQVSMAPYDGRFRS